MCGKTRRYRIRNETVGKMGVVAHRREVERKETTVVWTYLP